MVLVDNDVWSISAKQANPSVNMHCDVFQAKSGRSGRQSICLLPAGLGREGVLRRLLIHGWRVTPTSERPISIADSADREPGWIQSWNHDYKTLGRWIRRRTEGEILGDQSHSDVQQMFVEVAR